MTSIKLVQADVEVTAIVKKESVVQIMPSIAQTSAIKGWLSVSRFGYLAANL